MRKLLESLPWNTNIKAHSPCWRPCRRPDATWPRIITHYSIFIMYKSPANPFHPTNPNPLHPCMVDLEIHETSFFGVNLHEGLIHVSDEFLRRFWLIANVSHWPLHEGLFNFRASKPLKITFLRMRVFQKISTVSSQNWCRKRSCFKKAKSLQNYVLLLARLTSSIQRHSTTTHTQLTLIAQKQASNSTQKLNSLNTKAATAQGWYHAWLTLSRTVLSDHLLIAPHTNALTHWNTFTHNDIHITHNTTLVNFQQHTSRLSMHSIHSSQYK